MTGRMANTCLFSAIGKVFHCKEAVLCVEETERNGILTTRKRTVDKFCFFGSNGDIFAGSFNDAVLKFII